VTGESEENLTLMRWLDEQYTKTPFYGSPKMTFLLRQAGYPINHKRVERLMREMGLRAIAPGKATSTPSPGHLVYPYLLRGVRVEKTDGVWSSDFTYIRLRHGFVFLVAVIDWFSRFVLSWELSTTQDADFCVRALEAALGQGTPQIFNTDQGSQFTSEAFTSRLKNADIRISMDGRGRALDNIFVERLWRTVKYENVYLHDYETVKEARVGLTRYLKFYNEERIHQSLQYKTPAEVYRAGQRKTEANSPTEN